jgi:signal transduction histidine kinase/GAF domain-containing protein
VLDRILQAVQEMVGSTRCAVILIDQPMSSLELHDSVLQELQHFEKQQMAGPALTIRVAAQKGVHLRSQDWHPEVSEQVLVGLVMRYRRSLVIEDTSVVPEIEIPALNDEGIPRRPGSVLCVPIFEPTAVDNAGEGTSTGGPPTAASAVLGTIEVYHRRARGFPAEEVELLEQFAQQAGLAIQNARLFRSINQLATEQAAARERIEAEVVTRTAELAQRNQALEMARIAQELESARMQLLLERLPSGVMLVSAADGRITIINRLGVQLLQRMGWTPGRGDFPGEAGVFQPGTVNERLNGKAAPGVVDDTDLLAKEAMGVDIEELLRTIPIYGASGPVVPYEEHPLFLALHKGEAREAELHVTQPGGQTLYLLVNAAPLRASDGTITSAVSIWHDITQLKTLERARDDFFTTMAHELKTPLANIRAHVSALLANDLEWSPQERHDFLEAADGQVERLVGMINQFLDASRVEAGALRLELEPILLAEMFEDLQDRLEALIGSSQRRLEVDVPADLPAVMADYELIMSVLTNLLSNAFRYTPEGDIVRLEAETIFSKPGQEAAGVELRVIDYGPGLTQEQQAELFTRFSTFAAMSRPAADRPGQSAPASRRGSLRWSPATGLGLYISKGIIEAHGSMLRLKSNAGQGAVFAFILPTANAARREIH